MSRYTVQLRWLVENQEWTDEKLGLSDYPIFDESYRGHLNALIKDYFYFDEIGFETPARFAMKLRNKMHIIMPYYNQWYQSNLELIDPFINIDHTSKQTSVLQEILSIIRNNNKSGTSGTTGSLTESGERTGHTTDIGTTDTDNTSFTATEASKNSSGTTSSVDGSSNSVSESHNDTITDKSVHSDVRNEKDIYGESGSSDNDGMSVTSDTPEGFISTSAIGNGTYANTATKNESHSLEDKNGEKLHQVTDMSNANDTRKDTGNKSVSGNDSKNSGSIKTDIGEEKGQSRTVDIESGSTTKLGDSNEDYEKSVISRSDDIISEIANAIENSIKNQSGESNGIFKGFNGITMSEMLKQWRNTFINIDQLVLDELECLFLGVLN